MSCRVTYTNQYDTSHFPYLPVAEIAVGNPGESPPPVMLRGIVDSGADHTIVPFEVVERLNLPLWEEIIVKDFTGTEHTVPLYTAIVTIPTLHGHLIRVIGINNEHALLGRDILNRYKLTLNPHENTIEIE